MKGAFILSENLQLFEAAKDLIVAKGGIYAEDVGAVQIGGGGDHVFTLYDSAEPKWEYQLGPFSVRPGVAMPDMTRVVAFAAECNSESFFAELVKDIGLLSIASTWVLDGDGVVWSAREVDPASVRL